MINCVSDNGSSLLARQDSVGLTVIRTSVLIKSACLVAVSLGGLTPMQVANGEESRSTTTGKHLFILSGQSNMAGLRPEESFTPAVESAFGKENVLVVKDAHGGQPIRRWFKEWKDANGKKTDKTGDLYDRLMAKVDSATDGETLASVTLVWMQGERDAKEKHGSVYADSLQGLIQQIRDDMGRPDVNLVLGRLSDFSVAEQRFPDWILIREEQVKLANRLDNASWVDTDDLNDGKNRRGKEISNDLHYSSDGYVKLGKRFADAAIELVKSPSKSSK